MRIESFSVAVVVVVALSGCSKPDPLYCDPNTPCDDPERPYCDLEGEFPASEGLGRTCIAQPDFAVSLARDDAQVRIGGELALDVTIDRMDGFPGDIVVEATGLPAGVTADPVIIPGDASTGTLVIAGGDADPGALADATVTATASPAGGPIAHDTPLRLLVLGPAGSLDPTFGSLGFAGQPAGSGMDDAVLLMQLSSGGFIVGGPHTGSDVTGILVRFGPDGALDETFGAGGWAAIDFLGTDVDGLGTPRMVAQGADKIVLAVGSETGDVILVRVTSDAQRDPTFGDGGIAANEVTGVPVSVNAMAVGPSGEIVLGLVVNGGDTMTLVRYTADGQRDGGFAGDGRLDFDRGDSNYIEAIRVFADGSLLVSGSAIDGTRVPFAVRYTPTGSLDSEFGDAGDLVLPDGWDWSDILVDSEGRWMVGGAIDGMPAFYRLSSRGEVDPSFGADGAVPVPIPDGQTGSVRVLLPGEGDLVGVGSPDVLMTRLEGDAIDTTFGDGGAAIFTIEDGITQRAVRQADGRIVVLSDNDSLPFVLARFFD